MRYHRYLLSVLACTACGPTEPMSSAHVDAGQPISLGDASVSVDADLGTERPMVDGGYPVADGGVLRADRFVTHVVSKALGACAGFGLNRMPGVVEGPPIGGGDGTGSLDVLSLGNGGEIVLSFDPNAIVDGAGSDFIVFENPFLIGGDPHKPNAEPGEVSVSEDGVTWKTFPCTATAYPYGACAGWHPVYSSPSNGISPVDPVTAGGDPFDLADVGLASARFVRIRDKANEQCPPGSPSTTNGFDLDAISIVNARTP